MTAPRASSSQGEGHGSPIRFLEWRELGTGGREGYLRDMMQRGVRSMVENARAEVQAVAVAGHVVPLLIVEPRSENCDLCSPMAHHVSYSRDEVLHRLKPRYRWLLRPAYAVFELWLRLGHIDRVVYLNNWLFSTNPCLELSVGDLRALSEFLEEHFPGHAQIVRSVNPSLFSGQHELYSACGFDLIKTRDVFVWMLEDRSYLDRNNYWKDSRLLKRSKLDIFEPDHIDSASAERMSALYRTLYIGKHNTLNAVLTARFIKSTFDSGALRYRLLLDDGRIVAFYGFETVRDVYNALVIGYDLEMPRKDGLYRQVVMAVIHEAKQMGLNLNLSAGVDEFKAGRGGRSVREYEAVRFSYLPLRQRSAWQLLQLKCRLSVWVRAMTWKKSAQ